MRIAHLFGNTLREAPPEARTDAHRYLVCGAFVCPLAPGRFARLPLGVYLHQRLAAFLEARLPAAQPLALPPGAPNPGDLLRAEIHTYRNLPALLYAWQEVEHPPAGLLRARHHRALLAWHVGASGDAEPFRPALEALWEAAGLETVRAEAPGGGYAWLYPHPQGEDRLRRCPACGYAATRPAARRAKAPPPAAAPAPLEAVHTPGAKTIAQLAAFLGISPEQTAKAVFLNGARPDGTRQLVFAVLRGDMELSVDKLARLTGLSDLRPASEAEIRAIGAEPGFASPVGLSPADGFLLAVDDLIPRSPNLVAGANRPEYHLRNVNYGRDFEAHLSGDLAEARPGDPCPQCGQPLEARSAVLLARAAPWEASAAPEYADAAGAQRRAAVAHLHLDADAVLACAVEQRHDAYGPLWPPALAPFDVHIVALPGKKDGGESLRVAAALYESLQAAGLRVLLDDRAESPGVKFNDADLLGAPWRVTVGARALARGGVEVQRRGSRERDLVPPERLPEHLQQAGAEGGP